MPKSKGFALKSESCAAGITRRTSNWNSEGLPKNSRVMIEQHVQMAKSSLSTKQLAIIHRDQDQDGESRSGELTQGVLKAGD
jgi:hypothetical protein